MGSWDDKLLNLTAIWNGEDYNNYIMFIEKFN